MSDPVELILAFLKRHQFAKAEAAFKAELLTRNDGGGLLLTSEDFPDRDLQLHSPSNLQSSDGSASAANSRTAILPFDKDTLRGSSNKEDNFFGISREEARSPPEKQLYVEYEPGKLSFQDSVSTASQEFAFEEVRTLPGPEASLLLTAGEHVSFPIQDLDNALQGASWMSSFQQGKESLPCTQSSNSAEPLLVGTSVCQAKSEPVDHASTRCNVGVPQHQQFKPMIGSSKLQYQTQQEQSRIHVPQKELVSYGPEVPCNTFESEEGENSGRPSHLNEDTVPSSILIAEDGRVEASTYEVEHCEEQSFQVQNVLLTDPHSEGTCKDPALKTCLPLAFVEASQNVEQQRSLTPELNNGKAATGAQDVEDAEQITAWAIGGGHPVRQPHCENLELNSIRVHESEELPRLPPVRLHSIEKNMDILKKDGFYADDENSTRSFELKALESVEGVTGDDTLGWDTVLDCPVGQELPTSGSKRPVFRPSVSQGIVEALSEQLSGFGNFADGQNERWYPDEYCDSDTYEDDDDPGYHRQPIEDEEWFLAHEIDYPSDDDRARQQTEKNTVTDTKQTRKVDEDDRSFGEEESYFSGEEYYRLQAAKKEYYKSQQSELRKLVDQDLASTNLYALQTDNLLRSPGGDNGGDENGSQTFDADKLMRIRSQPVWKGFTGQANELDQDDVDFDGYRVDTTCADGIDDDNHGSVRSGGIHVSSDVADVGSEVRDSLLGGSSEGDTESFRDQEMVAYEPANRNFDSQEFRFNEKQQHMKERSASLQHLQEDNNKHDMVLQYYNEAWGLCKRATERELASRSTFESKVSSKELSKTKHLSNCNNKGMVDNGGSMFEGFSFPSPSSTNDVAVSTAGSGKSLWSNRESTAQGDEADGYGSGMVGPDDTLAAWKRKSNNSSPIICSSEENLQKLDMPGHSMGIFHSTDDYVSLEAKEHDIAESDVGGQLLKACQPLLQEEEDALAGQEEMRTLSADDDQFEIFDLRIIHRKNRTGFEEDKEFPVMINSVIAGRYHVTEYLGSAAFSKAIQAHDLHTGMDVCMKIIKNNKDFFDQSLDEIKLLKFVNKHDPVDKYHILRLYDYFYHREHLFIVCELLRANLYEFHKFNRESGGEVYFTMPRLQSITRQCLEALEFLHRLGIIHCDLKPENILVKSYSRCEIKIIDLGSSCFQTDHLCSYVQSRSYRAPEVILGLAYDQKIDIWSLGCILAELCTGNVLFQNDSLATLLARVVGILGPIDPEVLAKGRDTHKYFTKNHMLYERNSETDQLEYLLPKRTSLSHRLPMGDQGFVEFVRYLLQSNPVKRPFATEALQHPWLSHPYEPISS